jgi:hypothetical protein
MQPSEGINGKENQTINETEGIGYGVRTLWVY